MSAIENIRISAIGVSILILMAGGILLYPGARDYMVAIFGGGSVQEVDFFTLDPDPRFDHFLACPSDICAATDDFLTIDDLNISATELRNILLEFTDSLPTVSVRSFDMSILQFEFIERSPVRQIPDIITVRIFEKGPNRSALAIYSRSFSGRAEERSNERRVKRWLRMISPNEIA